MTPVAQHLRETLTLEQGHAEIRHFRQMIAACRAPRSGLSVRLHAAHYEGWLRAYLVAFGDPDAPERVRTAR